MRNLILVLFLALVAGCAGGQQDDRATPERIELTEREVEAVAAAIRETEAVQRKWSERLEHVNDEATHQSYSDQYRREMVSAVEDQGFTIEEYRAITEAARTDRSLAERIQRALEATDDESP